MLAVPGELPADQSAWQFELKWDGVRIIADWPGSTPLVLWSRNGRDVTAAYPELAGLGGDLGSLDVAIDGEVVALDEAGRPSFGLLQHRMHVSDPGTAAELAAEIPATYLAFDVVRVDGQPTTDLPLEDRRRLLEQLDLDGPAWKTTPAYLGDGDALLEVARSQNLEGIVAKRLGSRYAPGQRSSAWRKIKIVNRAEFVIAGWHPGDGKRAGTIGALVLGAYDTNEAGTTVFRHVGSVGTGFSDDELDRLRALLAERATEVDPFAEGPPRRPGTNFVRPELVAEIKFREWTRDLVLRHPSYEGLRADKPAGEVFVERL